MCAWDRDVNFLADWFLKIWFAFFCLYLPTKTQRAIKRERERAFRECWVVWHVTPNSLKLTFVFLLFLSFILLLVDMDVCRNVSVSSSECQQELPTLDDLFCHQNTVSSVFCLFILPFYFSAFCTYLIKFSYFATCLQVLSNGFSLKTPPPFFVFFKWWRSDSFVYVNIWTKFRYSFFLKCCLYQS